LVIGFIDHSHVITTNKYNTVTDFHTTKYSALVFSVYFHGSSLSVSWQRIYNTGTIKVSLNYTLPISLYDSPHKVFKSHVKSSQADFLYSSVLLKLTAGLLACFCRLLLTPPAYCFSFGILLTYVDAARTRLTENTCHVTATQPVNWRAGCCL
jgi:hypothetical protein